MNQLSGIYVQREPKIEGFIHILANQGDLHPKTVKEYASDLIYVKASNTNHRQNQNSSYQKYFVNFDYNNLTYL
ncbi:hypothetical protein [Paenibacillus sp.]